jgi:hypothetical protein
LEARQGKYLLRLILKIPNTKKGWWSGSSCRVPA